MIKPTVVPEIYAIDLDFTMYRSDVAFEDMVLEAVAMNLATESVLREARGDIESSGGSFEFIEHLASEGVPRTKLEELLVTFSENKDGTDYLYPDALPMLDALRLTKTPFFTYTKGGHSTQVAKLLSCGLLDDPYMITNSIFKGKDLSAMRQENGTYMANVSVGQGSRQSLVARSIFLVEDKPVSFDGLPSDCAGALVSRVERPRRATFSELPGRVVVKPDLSAVTHRIYQNSKV